MAKENVEGKKLLDVITIAVSNFIANYKKDGNLNYIEEGIVKELLIDGKAKVIINENEKELPVLNNASINVNDVVLILTYNYDKNRRMILGKRPKW